MNMSKLLSLNPGLARTAAALAGLSLMAAPAVSSAQSAPASAPPAASSQPAAPSPVPSPPAAPVASAAPTSPAPEPPERLVGIVAPAASSNPTTVAPTTAAPTTLAPATVAPDPLVGVVEPASPASTPQAPREYPGPQFDPVAAVPPGMPAGVMIDGARYFDVTPQTDSQGRHVYSIDTGPDGQPINQLLGVLCQAAGVSYTVSPNVQGAVSVYLKSLPFETALHSILEASDPPMSYRIEDGVYHFFAKADPADDSALPQTKVSLDLDNAPLDEALKQLFDSVHASYTLRGDNRVIVAFGKTDVVGTRSPVTLHLHDVSFGAALRALLSTANPALTYRVKDGIVYIGPASATAGSPQFWDQAPSDYRVVQPDQLPLANPGAQDNVYKLDESKGQIPILKDLDLSPKPAQPAQPGQPAQPQQ